MLKLCLSAMRGLLLIALVFAPCQVKGQLSPPVTDFSQLASPGKHRATLEVDGHLRKVIVYTPTHFKNGTPLPLVFFFHGMGGNSEQAAHTYGWVEKAEKETFFGVFPEGLGIVPDQPANFVLNPNIWRDERSDIPNQISDIHFFEILLQKLTTALPVDAHRIYVTGFSNGAGMTFTLGSHFSDRLAAIAPVSSQSFVRIKSLPRPLPVYYLVGKADPLIPIEGGTTTLPWGITRTWPPVQESVDLWARLNGCPAQPEVISADPIVRVVRYGPGKSNAEVVFTTIEGNGHHWPGSHEPLPRAISGPIVDPFPATDRIWDFFVQHPLP